MKRIVIYGGEMSGVCAAIKAGEYLKDNDFSADEYKVALIIPYPNLKLGGLGTVGGLNVWDKAFPAGHSDRLVQGGTFSDIILDTAISNAEELNIDQNTIDDFEENQKLALIYGQWYRNSPEMQNSEVDDMGKYLKGKIDNLIENSTVDPKNYIEIISEMDIVGIDSSESNGKKTIQGLYLRSVFRSPIDGRIKWGRKTRYLSGDTFIDASDDGKLTSAMTIVTTGRHDWPENYLEAPEKMDYSEYPYYLGRQQCASLYFRIKVPGQSDNMPWYHTKDTEKDEPALECVSVSNGVYYGTYENTSYGVYRYNFVDHDVNNNINADVSQNTINHLDDPYIIKTYNLGRNGPGSSEYWANTLLLFNVDGRAHYRDLITGYYPEAMISDNIDRDSAWNKCVEIIKAPDFLGGLKGFNFVTNNSTIVTYEESDEPIVAPIMYIRESVHLPVETNIGELKQQRSTRDTEDNYAISAMETFNAGYKYQTDRPTRIGGDGNPIVYTNRHDDYSNYATRIGLGFYSDDLHPYTKSDFVYFDSTKNQYMTRAAKKIARPDIYANNKEFTGCAFYIPYECIHTDRVSNLLVAGNASSVSSFAWGEMRVLPNLCVLGDAAGIISAYCITTTGNNNTTLSLDVDNISSIIGNIRSIMNEYDIITEK